MEWASPEEKEDILTAESEQVYRIVSVSFKEGNKWRVSDGSHTYWVTISDEMFLNGVNSGEMVFSSQDHLKVKVVTRQWYENGELKIQRDIVRVLELVSAPKQLEMNLIEDTEE